MIKTYEVRLELESGHTLNVLVAADSPQAAKADVTRILRGINVHAHSEYDPDGTEVREVVVRDEPASPEAA